MTSSFSFLIRRHVSQVTAAALLLSSGAVPAAAQTSRFTDVPEGAYYEEAASALVDLGALDSAETRLRPSALATRAELVKLLVNLRSEQLLYPTPSSFNDVVRGTWYAPYFEAAAHVGWVHGDGNCYQNVRPCYARPADGVNRAEAAALLVRAFDLEHTGSAPRFADNTLGEWYYTHIQASADHCVLQGDGDTGFVRPSARMNRAEMIVMFHRAYQELEYGSDCGTQMPRVSGVTAFATNRLRVTFTADVDDVRMQEESRYVVAKVSGGATVGVSSAVRVDDRTVELRLSEDLQATTAYMLTARNLLAETGVQFSDTARFESSATPAGQILSATGVAAQRIRVTFDTDIEGSSAQDSTRYVVSRVGSGTLGISSVTRLDARNVELQLTSALSGNVSYRVNVENMRATSGSNFSDSTTFVFPLSSLPDLTSAVALSTTRLRLVFNTDLDVQRAEQVGRYVVTDGQRTLSLRTANLLSDKRTVEIELTEAMAAQRAYTVFSQELKTTTDQSFTDSAVVGRFEGATVNFRATLNGGQEVPSLVTPSSGTGTFVLAGTGLQYDITVKNMSGAITAAHFHVGDPGVSGPVLGPITFTGNRATGTWTGITEEQRNQILDGRIYANVHTAAHPDGEIRGQLVKVQ